MASRIASTDIYRTIDEFYAVRGWDWLALREMLAEIGGRSTARLDPSQLGEFSRLYRAVSSDLAIARLRFPRSPIVTDLNRLVWHAHSVLYAEQRHFWARLGRYLVAGYPQAVRRNKWFVLAGAFVLVAGTVAGILWFKLDASKASDAFDLAKLEDHFVTGISPVRPGEGVLMWVAIAANNIFVSMSAFAAGMLACLGTLFYLTFNGLFLGAVVAYTFSIGQGGALLRFVPIHGVLELSLIVLAGAAGMRIGWTLIAPGRRRRGRALQDAGREAMRVLVGSLLWLVVAGLIEGLLSTTKPDPVIAIALGVTIGIGFWTYIIAAGRPQQAHKASTNGRAF